MRKQEWNFLRNFDLQGIDNENRYDFSNIRGLNIKVDTSEARGECEKWHLAGLQLTDEDFLSAPRHEMVINNLPCLVGKKY